MRLCVLNVRYLPGLWGYYDGRMAVGGDGAGGGDIWRERVREATRERVEMAQTRDGHALWGRGRGKLMMLAPFGWDSLV